MKLLHLSLQKTLSSYCLTDAAKIPAHIMHKDHLYITNRNNHQQQRRQRRQQQQRWKII